LLLVAFVAAVAGWLLLGRPARLLAGMLSDGAPGPGAVRGGRCGELQPGRPPGADPPPQSRFAVKD
jgi:hypothetical protein